MTAQLIAVDAAALDRVLTRMEAIEALLKQSHIQPASEWVSVADYARMNKRSTETVRRWIREGRVDTKMDGSIRKVKAL